MIVPCRVQEGMVHSFDISIGYLSYVLYTCDWVLCIYTAGNLYTIERHGANSTVPFHN